MSTKVHIVEGASLHKQKLLGSKDYKSRSPTECPEGVNCISPHERLFRNTVVYFFHHIGPRETKDKATIEENRGERNATQWIRVLLP